MNNRVLLYFFFVCAFLNFAENSSSAADCSSALTAIEKALCGDDLLDLDQRMNEAFAKLHDVLPDTAAAALSREQQAWLKDRDAACGSSRKDLVPCLKTMTLARIRAIRKKPSGEHPVGEATLTPGHDLILGDRRLTVLMKEGAREHRDDAKYQIVYNDNLIIDAHEKLEVVGKFHNKVVDAVAVAVDRGGYLDCADFAVIEARHGEPLRTRHLKVDEYVCGWDVDDSPDGFIFTDHSGDDSISGQAVYLWDYRGYFGFRRRIAFEARPGTKLDAIDKVTEGDSPLRNEEFLHALKAQTGHDWKVFATALEYSHPMSTDVDDKFTILAGCKTLARDRCSRERGRYQDRYFTSGFAAVNAKDHQVFFAVLFEPDGMSEDAGRGGSSGQVELTTYPSRDKWPTELAPVLQSWVQDVD